MLVRFLSRTHHLRPVRLRCPPVKPIYLSALRTMSSAAPSAVESTAQPASNPAIQKATGTKKQKEKKGEAAGSSHPLEVRDNSTQRYRTILIDA